MAAPKPARKSSRQFFLRTFLIFGVSVCLALFLASPAMAQRGSHAGGSHGGSSHGGGGGHASASHGGGGHFGGARAGGFAHASPAPARMSGSAKAEANASGGSMRGAGISLTSAPDSSSAGLTNARLVSPRAVEITLPDRGLHTIFVSGAGRMSNAAIEGPPAGREAFAARNHLWQAPPAPAKPAQTPQPPQPQQQQRAAAPPPVPVRPAPMPIAPPMMSPPVIARPMPGPVVMTPPVMTPPVMTPPMARIPITGAPLPVTPHPAFGAPRAIPIPSPNPNVHPIVIPPAPARGRLRMLPITPRQQFRVGDTLPPRFGLATQTPLPIPPKFRHIVLEPGIGSSAQVFGVASSFGTNPVPPLFCNSAFPGCGFGFDGDFDLDDGFFSPSVFFFSFGGPFGFGGPCLFDGFFLNCFGGAWNGPFGWNWGTPWGYNPALIGSLYPIGGYYSPTPMELNQASVNSIGPSTFLPPPPAQLALAPSEAVSQPVAYLVTKDGIEFGVTKYWVEDNRICYVTTYNIQSCLSLDQLDLQTTVDINYKRGITFTLAPKPADQTQPQ